MPRISCPSLWDKELASQAGLTPFGGIREHAIKVQDRVLFYFVYAKLFLKNLIFLWLKNLWLNHLFVVYNKKSKHDYFKLFTTRLLDIFYRLVIIIQRLVHFMFCTIKSIVFLNMPDGDYGQKQERSFSQAPAKRFMHMISLCILL